MMRPRFTPFTTLVLVLLIPAGSLAQTYTGTYTAANQQGGVITLTLPDGEQRYVEYRAESPGRHNRYYFDGTLYFRK